ncbi:MAG: hypothetical protein EZS28_003869 [Streblomastix strix]|uniref:Uncharacterized protein n=1 Tax=Streblomastix strix TaxID=222440 RepID=A0A5J4X1F8_9EUKA|nr:MAG: hypothetical protein EZS28_003869 [Streblomastix strix]
MQWEMKARLYAEDEWNEDIQEDEKDKQQQIEKDQKQSVNNEKANLDDLDSSEKDEWGENEDEMDIKEEESESESNEQLSVSDNSRSTISSQNPSSSVTLDQNSDSQSPKTAVFSNVSPSTNHVIQSTETGNKQSNPTSPLSQFSPKQLQPPIPPPPPLTISQNSYLSSNNQNIDINQPTNGVYSVKLPAEYMLTTVVDETAQLIERRIAPVNAVCAIVGGEETLLKITKTSAYQKSEQQLSQQQQQSPQQQSQTSPHIQLPSLHLDLHPKQEISPKISTERLPPATLQLAAIVASQDIPNHFTHTSINKANKGNNNLQIPALSPQQIVSMLGTMLGTSASATAALIASIKKLAPVEEQFRRRQQFSFILN